MRVSRRAVFQTVAALVPALALGPVAAPADAQPKTPRIGVLVFASLEGFQADLRQGLQDFGYVEGQNLHVEWRSAGSRDDRLAEHAAELVRLNVDAIVAWPTPAVHAARKATTSIPIIMLAGDPVGTGLVASLARPGGNVTGMAMLTADLNGKKLELMREVLPGLGRVAIVTHATDPFNRPFLGMMTAATGQLGMQLHPHVVVRSAAECDAAFATIARERVGVVFVQPVLVQDPAWSRRVGEFALKHRLAAIAERYFTATGGLLSYGADLKAARRQIASFVDRILKGAKPAELPVAQPTKFELVVNLKTARALGITIPNSVLLRADEVIDR